MKDDEFAALAHRATHDLTTDVASVVADASRRGRRDLRRRRIGSAFVAAGLTAAVTVGVATLPDWNSEPTPVAEEGPGFASAPSGSSSLGPYQQPAAPDRPITIDAEDVPRLVGEAVGAQEIGPLLDEHPYPLIAEDQEMILHFRLDGALTTVVISPADAQGSCQSMAEPEKMPKLKGAKGTAADGPKAPKIDCHTVDNIEVAAVTTGTVGSALKVRSVMAWNHGYRIDVVSYNAAAGKNADGSEDVPILREQLVDAATLVELATSEAWFE